jgi:hypothetical protein
MFGYDVERTMVTPETALFVDWSVTVPLIVAALAANASNETRAAHLLRIRRINPPF